MELLVVGALFAGFVMGAFVGPSSVRSAACSVAALALAAIFGMAYWWRRQVRREMCQVVLDPRRCLRCDYPLAELEGSRCPECGEPMLPDPCAAEGEVH